LTLILAINGRESIWMLADRRLSFRGHPPREDGRKVMFLETTDAVAILGYAGLGATARGTEPADWMSAVLRGRNLPLERSLDELAGALRRQFPKHLQRLPKGVHAAHSILVPAFVGAEVRLYTIDMALAPDRKTCSFRYTRHIVGEFGPRPSRTPRLGLAGSGATYLARDRHWVRNLMRLVRASDRQQVSPHAVADHLAGLNHRTISTRPMEPSVRVASLLGVTASWVSTVAEAATNSMTA
jgi:hypothetical protein